MKKIIVSLLVAVSVFLVAGVSTAANNRSDISATFQIDYEDSRIFLDTGTITKLDWKQGYYIIKSSRGYNYFVYQFPEDYHKGDPVIFAVYIPEGSELKDGIVIRSHYYYIP